jgi:hypothetical protein
MMTTEQLAQEFCNCTLPKAEWTHEAHLRVGLWHLLRASPSESLDQLREQICRYNISVGGQNTETSGYHETITRFYVWAITRFLTKVDRDRPVDELSQELIRDIGDRNLPYQYWTKDRLMSTEARQQWVDPDIHPLEQ